MQHLKRGTLFAAHSLCGVNGCFEANDTLAKRFSCNLRSIQRARKLLFHQGDIVIDRTKRFTWSMWSAYHPAVRSSKKLHFKGGSTDNPVYEIPPIMDNDEDELYTRVAIEVEKIGPVESWTKAKTEVAIDTAFIDAEAAERYRVTFCQGGGDILSPNKEPRTHPTGVCSSKSSQKRNRPAADASLSQGGHPLEIPLERGCTPL